MDATPLTCSQARINLLPSLAANRLQRAQATLAGAAPALTLHNEVSHRERGRQPIILGGGIDSTEEVTHA